jgi:hypothetical protein
VALRPHTTSLTRRKGRRVKGILRSRNVSAAPPFRSYKLANRFQGFTPEHLAWSGTIIHAGLTIWPAADAIKSQTCMPILGIITVVMSAVTVTSVLLLTASQYIWAGPDTVRRNAWISGWEVWVRVFIVAGLTGAWQGYTNKGCLC